MIWALLALTVVAVVGFGVALTVRSRQDFAEQNEVVPGRPSPAPASWAGAHSREARLHRRLGDAVKGAHANPRFVELGLGEQMAMIDAEAPAIDERLVAAANLPSSHKDEALDRLEEHVVELEATIADVVTSVSVADSKEQLQQAVSAADVRLRALAEARAEVERLDQRIARETAAANDLITNAPPDSASSSEAEGEPGEEPGTATTSPSP